MITHRFMTRKYQAQVLGHWQHSYSDQEHNKPAHQNNGQQRRPVAQSNPASAV